MVGTGQDGRVVAAGAVAGGGAVADRGRDGEDGAPRRAFRWVSGLAAVVGVVLFGIGLAEIVLMWLSDATLLSLIDHLKPSELDFRAQFAHVGVVSWALVPPLVVQQRRPARRGALVVQALAVAVGGVVVMAAAGALGIVDVVVLAVLVLVVWLHPCAGVLFQRPRFDGLQARVVGIGALPWLVATGFYVHEAWASRGAPGIADTTPQLLWANSALVPVIIVLLALAGATDHGGWQLPAWTAALAAVDVGAHSLAFSDQAASLPAPAAVAAIAWGVAYGAAAVGRSRRSTRAEEPGRGRPGRRGVTSP